MIDAAIEAGVKRFLPSEFGFDTEDDRTLEVAPCTIMKKDPIEHLKARKDKISWTSIVNGLWLDWVSVSSIRDLADSVSARKTRNGRGGVSRITRL